MHLLNRLLGRSDPIPPNAGPLYLPVLEVMSDVQSYARSHGGKIELVSVSEDGEVIVKMSGACQGCPMSTVTLKLGIERQLRELVPGIRKVTAKK